jgi:predicted phosphoadenosine phosphosulfate sulfurtransferase
MKQKNQIYRNPDELIKYNGHQSNEVELLKTMPPTLKQFYKNKVNQYFYNFEELLEK